MTHAMREDRTVRGSHVTSTAPLASEHLSDESIDALNATLRRLRRSMVKPPQTSVPMPSLGRPVDFATVVACTAIRDLVLTLPVVTVKDVAGALELKHSTVSRLLGEIEAEGLVQRRTDVGDRRRTTVNLTAAGEAVVTDATDMMRFMLRTVLHGWSEPDMTHLTTLLARLADSVALAMPTLATAAGEHFCGDVVESPPHRD